MSLSCALQLKSNLASIRYIRTMPGKAEDVAPSPSSSTNACKHSRLRQIASSNAMYHTV